MCEFDPAITPAKAEAQTLTPGQEVTFGKGWMTVTHVHVGVEAVMVIAEGFNLTDVQYLAHDEQVMLKP